MSQHILSIIIEENLLQQKRRSPTSAGTIVLFSCAEFCYFRDLNPFSFHFLVLHRVLTRVMVRVNRLTRKCALGRLVRKCKGIYHSGCSIRGKHRN